MMCSSYMGMLVNKYLNTARLYRQGLPDASEDDQISKMITDGHRKKMCQRDLKSEA